PNNPTGVAFTETEMSRIIAACERVGAWLHADEVYRATERTTTTETPSFWGRYSRAVCTNSLSKAYGLAGLRIGWVIADRDTIEELWRRHEYSVIAAAAPSMTLAAIALQPAKRATLIARQREIRRNGVAVLDEWLAAQRGRFSVRPSAATAIGFVHYDLPVSSFELAEHIRLTERLLVAPGEFMGADHHLRITVGYEAEKIRRALERVARAADALATTGAAIH
ncbi:MAG TPA: aminotransferase class I/II-fold pyridoxal phosphate-dependent enzyme, partial [Gemmatimonadaceae bacterium]|nr:aminotransferase class I/II-fold pyridoxal phosphate-dependent enzyme [Gemmatimonadaceae bacterium]